MSRQTIAVSVKASKLTARALAYVVAAVGRKIAKEHRKAQTPHGKQSVRKLMGHGGDTNAIEVDTPIPRLWATLPTENHRPRRATHSGRPPFPL